VTSEPFRPESKEAAMLAPLPGEVQTYAVMDGDKMANLVRTDDPSFASREGWLGPIPTDSEGPEIGWTTSDAGATWQTPSAE
jgi:hypothetical protein